MECGVGFDPTISWLDGAPRGKRCQKSWVRYFSRLKHASTRDRQPPVSRSLSQGSPASERSITGHVDLEQRRATIP